MRFNHIKKQYGTVEALKDVSIDVIQGELFGFIGPDGAGKTTLFRILTSLVLPDAGSAFIGSLDVVKDYKKIRKSTGYMPGRFSLYSDLTVEENLQFYARIFKTSVKENYDLISDIYRQIEPFKKRRAGDLSGGMKQKLALSCALIHNPEVLVLDEPTTGVDAVSRMEFWELLKKMQKKGITILVSTPYMDEASLCDRVALMEHGELLAVDTPACIEKSFTGNLLAVKSNQMYGLLSDLPAGRQVLEQFPDATQVFRFGEFIHITFQSENTAGIIEDLTNYLKSKGHQEIQISPIKPVIEDCFLALMDQPAKR
ncbi:MAG: ATPase [Bacteroidetes bacterium GWF2_41_31]|nr:MAG: ATPase [Bacteroidetes bacterium GWF2_41_31]OFZ07104.1 MAG: ATPase [Bacteroidetes bacterium RIFOXYB12_FULL_41_6]